jgi:DinB family protein
MTNQGPLALTREIDEFRRQFEQISADADALVAPLGDDQFTWKPGPTKWSVAECLEHLNATARSYLPAIDEGIADAIRHGAYAEGPFHYNMIGRLFSHLMEPPARVRMSTSTDKQPGPHRPKRETLAGFRAYQVQYVDRLRQANGIDLSRSCVRSPLASWIRIPLGSAFASMAAHERRHLWQARRITQMDGFPSPG